MLWVGSKDHHTQWPESSGLGNVVDFWLATLPMALPPKNFLHFQLDSTLHLGKTYSTPHEGFIFVDCGPLIGAY